MGEYLTIIDSANRLFFIIGCICIPLEVVYFKVWKRDWRYCDKIVNVICGSIIFLISIAVGFELHFRVLSHVYDRALFEIPINPATFVLHIICGDLAFYCFHRLAHSKYFFLVDHNVHHSSDELDFTTNLRVSPFAVFYSWLPLVPFVYLGCNYLLLFACFVLANNFPVILHMKHPVSFGCLEWLFNSPKHHRVHHAHNVCYRNKNFGGLFIIWDRLFGTFAEEHEQAIFAGKLTPHTRNPLQVMFGGVCYLANTAIKKARKTSLLKI